MLLEYKFFEPAFYHTDVPDWGTAYAHCLQLGREGQGVHRHRPPRARAPTSNSSWPACCASAKLGAFDFNSRFYADDDLMVGAADPFQLFRIMLRGLRGGGYTRHAGVTFMLDQCHNIEPKIPARSGRC